MADVLLQRIGLPAEHLVTWEKGENQYMDGGTLRLLLRRRLKLGVKEIGRTYLAWRRTYLAPMCESCPPCGSS